MTPRNRTDLTDAELVSDALGGQCEAYEELVRRWAARVTAVCRSRVRCLHAAEDLAQETLLRGFRELSGLREPRKFGAWLRGIAHRVCLDWLKLRQTSQVSFSTLAETHHPDRLLAGDPEAAQREVDRNDETRRVMEVVETLPDDQREVLMLYYSDELTYRDLAGMLGVSSATINARLTRARMALRRRLSSLRR